jgi:hypothetical protein
MGDVTGRCLACFPCANLLVNHRFLRSENLVAFKSSCWTVLYYYYGIYSSRNSLCVLVLLPGNNHFLHATQVWKVVFHCLGTPLPHCRRPGSVPRHCVALSMFAVWLVCRLDPNTALPSAADLKTASAAGPVCKNVCV